MATETQLTQNKAVSRRFFEEVLNGRDLNKIDDLFAETYTHHDAVTQKELHGRRELKKSLEQYMNAFSDGKMTIIDQLADEGHVATRLTMEGTHDGPFAGIEPTGKHVKMEGIVEHRFKDGKIVEGFPQWDMLGLMRQVGAIPDQLAD